MPDGCKDNHYYDDGDVALISQSTVFKVHSVLLRLACNFFKVRLSDDWSSDSERALDSLKGDVLCKARECKHHIIMHDEDPADISLLLSVIYPNHNWQLSWKNIGTLWRLADKYIAETLLRELQVFANREFHAAPLTALWLAEKYVNETIYQKASTYVINDINEYVEKPLFAQLSVETRCKLYMRRLKIWEDLMDININRNRVCDANCYRVCNEKLRCILNKITGPILLTLQAIELVSTNTYTHTFCTKDICNQIVALLNKYGGTKPTIASLAKQPKFFIQINSP
ncbi:hypothetical protein BC938DRAFT_480254 [Jimgerdemannia flammicorona]|uniref:BTB domain-containing protein n=1 Tax=Jimgerdemannia flammicorona TaxID=994334 RepID=A0A433QIZ7_9FUNG|nr:hypothetical protein BC938DRAFT_480254 [Jimgerdemannia flammicorona]